MVTPIWHPETGITPIEGDWRALRATEVESIRIAWGQQRERLAGSQALADFNERLNREWAIETGIIENLYDFDRGVTQTLIERGFRTEFLSHARPDQSREYVVRLLDDQKDALEGVFDFVAQRRTLSTSYVKELQAALLHSQTHTEGVDSTGNILSIQLIQGDWKTQPNSPTRDGETYTYCPPEQVASEMDRLVERYLAYEHEGVSPEVRAAWLHHRFTQIHPFQDGNGRVARALASLVLIQAGLFPLVVDREDKPKYLDALEAADGGALKSLVDLIARLQQAQFLKASAISEAIFTAGTNVRQVLDELNRAVERLQEQQNPTHQAALERVRLFEAGIHTRFDELQSDILVTLKRAANDAEVIITVSDPGTYRDYLHQIDEAAKEWYNYVPNTVSHQSWICMTMRWQRSANLVFHFHALGNPLDGNMVCLPFLELNTVGFEKSVHRELIRVIDAPFVIFASRSDTNVLTRFQPSREHVLANALRKLTRRL